MRKLLLNILAFCSIGSVMSQAPTAISNVADEDNKPVVITTSDSVELISCPQPMRKHLTGHVPKTYTVHGQMTCVGNRFNLEQLSVSLNGHSATISNGIFTFDSVPVGKQILLIQTPTATRRWRIEVGSEHFESIWLFDNYIDFISVAKENINNGVPKLYELGGVAPVIFSGEYGFKAFCKKFSTVVDVVGCLVETDGQTYVDCNYLVFDWLTEKYGDEWRSGRWRPMLQMIAGFDFWEYEHEAKPTE